MEILKEYIKIAYNRHLNLRSNRIYGYSEEKVIILLKKWYFKKTGKELNLENPGSMNEKIQWLKLYESTQLKADLTDKFLVRDWVTDRIGKQYLIPLLGAWDSYSEIDFNTLPDKFVLKTNNSSGTNLIVADKSAINHKLFKLKIDRWLNSNFAIKSGFELHYGLIQPKVICEQHMGENINDYKFFCINGEPQFIWVDLDRYIKHRRKVYDFAWKQAPFFIGDFERIDDVDDEKLKPKNLSKMIEIARELSKDFYEIDGQIFFGEMTFTPSSGTERFSPEKYDKYFGDMIRLPKPKKIPLHDIEIRRKTYSKKKN